MLKTVKDACTIHPSTLDYQISSGVESLFQTINAEDRGQEFFKKNYLTRGMEELLREGLLRLSGRSEQALFELMQAMGGGKTHLMSCLGLLAKFPERRAEILPQDLLDRLDNNPARVAIFDGRESPDNYLWGRLAEQLDASEIIRPYWENGPKPPDKTAWKKAIGDAPTLILFDELPPYFLEAKTVSVGHGSLADVVTRALSNLFAAALELPRICIVLANLADSYQDQVKKVQSLVMDVQREASRQARKITPVSLEGNEIYAIIRKRLFKELPSQDVIDDVGRAYAEQIKVAEDGGFLTARSMEQVEDEVNDTYPFHPAFKHLVALFKDNPDFRETRGLLQFAARVIKSVWSRNDNNVFLIGTQYLNLNDPQVMDEVANVNRALRPAIATDIADRGNAHAEEIDANLGSDAGSQVGCLILSSSLSLAVKGHTGLRQEEIIEYLVSPNRKPDEFLQAFEQLRKIAWYLHADGELFYFKDTENLTKRVQREAKSIPQAKADNYLKIRLEHLLQPKSKKAYQELLVMPNIDEINLSSLRVLVVVPPDGSVPPEVISRFYDSVENKNLLLVLSGNDSHMAGRVEENLRELYAIEAIQKSSNLSETLRQQAEDMQTKSLEAFIQSLQSAYNRLFYPGEDGLQQATIENGLKFGDDDENNAEKQIEQMLASMRCDNKLAIDLESDPLPYFSMAEEELWPANQRRTPWSDILMRAKTHPVWPWMPGPKGMDYLKAQALARGRWREGSDGYLEKGPFPKEKTSVNVVVQSRDEQSEETVLSLTPKNAGQNPRVHFSPDPNVSENDPVVEDLESFRTKEPTLYFLAVDPSGEHETGEPEQWKAKLKIRHQVLDEPEQRKIKLKCTPEAKMYYTLDGSNPREGAHYSEPIPISDEEVILQVYACAGAASSFDRFKIPAKGVKRVQIEESKPAKLVRNRTNLGSTEAVFDLIQEFQNREGIFFKGVTLNIGQAEKAMTIRFNDRSVDPATLKRIITGLREGVGEPDALVQLTIRDEASFPTGFDLKAFAKLAGVELTQDKVEQ